MGTHCRLPGTTVPCTGLPLYVPSRMRCRLTLLAVPPPLPPLLAPLDPPVTVVVVVVVLPWVVSEAFDDDLAPELPHPAAVAATRATAQAAAYRPHTSPPR